MMFIIRFATNHSLPLPLLKIIKYKLERPHSSRTSGYHTMTFRKDSPLSPHTPAQWKSRSCACRQLEQSSSMCSASGQCCWSESTSLLKHCSFNAACETQRQRQRIEKPAPDTLNEVALPLSGSLALLPRLPEPLIRPFKVLDSLGRSSFVLLLSLMTMTMKLKSKRHSNYQQWVIWGYPPTFASSAKYKPHSTNKACYIERSRWPSIGKDT
jgi:hypothetical protein